LYEFTSYVDERLSIGFSTEEYLRLGPFNDYTVVAFEDAVWGWLRLLVYQVEQRGKSEEEIESLSRGFGLPIALFTSEQIPQRAMDRIRSGRDVAFLLGPRKLLRGFQTREIR
jgi:hypothetical protein